MAALTNKLPVEQPGNPLPALNPQQKESLIMLIVLNFAEEHSLLNAEQLEDAKASLRALFLRATGEETMLRKLIGILKINRALNKTFSDMAHVLEGIRKSNGALAGKHEALTQQLAVMAISPEENARFVGPLLEFSNLFLNDVLEFDRQMTEYKQAKEAEARSAHIFRLAEEARERLKQRFEQGATNDGQQEQRVKQKVIQTFNYAEAESEYQYARRSAKSVRKDVEDLLKVFHLVCQMAMKPDMRSPTAIHPASGRPPCPDIYTITVAGMERFPRLRTLIPAVQDLLRLYQRSYGMFMLDFDKFNKALGPMIENTEDYFQAKEQDEDVRTKQMKLEQIEALIAYVEDVSLLLRDGQAYTYPRFSMAVSSHIMRAGSKWPHIAESLLQMKVTAEAELSTRLA
jgi:hypothetical protein